MKFKDYFNKLKETGKIKNEAFDKFLETVPEAEMPDEIFPIIEDTFLTKERALTHKDVAGKIKSEILDTYDAHLKDFYKLLPANLVLDIEKEESTFKKSKMVRDALPEVILKAAKAPNDEEAKKKIQANEATIQELTEKFNKVNSSHQEELTKIKDQSASEFKNYKLNSELEKLANSYTFADVFKDTRSELTKAKLDKIRSENKLDLIEKDGSFQIAVYDNNGTPKFDGNTPITINSLLEPALKPFLKANNTEQQDQKPKTQQFQVNDQPQGLRRGGNVQVAV